MKTTLNFKTYDGNKKRCYSDMNSDGTITVWTTISVDFEISCFIDGFSKSFIEMTDKETEEAENIAISKTLKKAITLFKNAENFETVKPYLEMLLKNNEYACFNEIRNSGNAFEIEMTTDSNSVNCYIRVCEQFETETAETAEALAEASALILAEAEEAEQAEATAEAEEIAEAIEAAESYEILTAIAEQAEEIARKHNNSAFYINTSIFGKLAEQAKAKAKEYATAEQAEIIAIEEAIEEAETMRYYAEASASAEEIEAIEAKIEMLKNRQQKLKEERRTAEQAEAIQAISDRIIAEEEEIESVNIYDYLTDFSEAEQEKMYRTIAVNIGFMTEAEAIAEVFEEAEAEASDRAKQETAEAEAEQEQEQQKKQKLLKLNMQYFATGKRIEAEAEADKNYIVEVETIATGAKKYGICTKAEAIAEANRNDKIIVTVLRRTTAEEEAEEQEQKQKLLKLKKQKQNRKTEEAIEAIKTMFQLFLFWIITATASEQEQQNRQKQKLLKLNMQYFAKAKAEQEQQKKKDYKYIMILANNTAYYFTSIKACYKYCKSFMFNFNRHSKTTLKRIDKNSFEITNFIDFKKLYGNNADNFTCVFHIYKINTDKCDIFEINSYNDRY